MITAICCIALFSCGTKQQEPCLLTIPLLPNNAIVIDGKIDHKEWDGSEMITSLVSPWEKREVPETVFYVCANKDYLYFAFHAVDKNIAASPSDKEEDVALGDRIEIFFAGDKDLKEYYCLEIAPYGDILDYKASFYRNFDYQWDAPDLQVKTSVYGDGYIVEGRLPLSFLPEINDNREEGKCFYMSIYRGDSAQYNDGSILWLTWIDPNVEEPDFHLFSSFAKVCIR